jgi:protein CpxP
MKHKLFAIALGGMLALGAQAALYAQEQAPANNGPRQGQWGHGHRHMMDPDRQLAHLTKTLNLSADQQSQIKPLLVDRQEKMQALWKDQSLSREDRHSKVQAIRQDTRTRLEATLTDQQKQQFEALQAKMQEHRQQRMGGPNQAPTGAPQPE